MDAFVGSLNYNPDAILAVDGDKITNTPVTTGSMQGGTFVVVSREKKSISSADADISIINGTVAEVYPGALLLANRELVRNTPTIVSVPRKPVQVSLDLPGLAGKTGTLTVDSPTRSSVGGAVNSLLETWNAGPGKEYPEIPAKMQFEETMVYSKSQVEAKFGYANSPAVAKLGIDFEAIHRGEKQVAVASFTQIYYTVSVDAPQSPSAMIAGTVDDLKRAGVSASTPPVYVSDVHYGRRMFVKLETTSTSNEVSAAFSAAFKGHDINASTKYSEILKNTSVRAVVYGGASSGQAKVITGNLDQLRAVINEGANYSRKNPGAPISYTTRFLKNNAKALVLSNSDYIETRREVFKQGSLILKNKGSYVAQFKVTWNEISFDKAGKEISTPKEWEGNWADRTIGYSTIISLPANARNINVFAREATGLAWDWWRTVIDARDLPQVHERTVTLRGTTLIAWATNDVTEPAK
ncbi:thiol-activated cytolysin family protein [Devriesea agamarum]|uniref:thiol-activated cytolysin family protein n=1 Tax=Devriesea agamarum TaxID=472569 RepID=UPI00155F532C|nr:thiol-activated cytolysin family protein [Devriesea agamarum]